MSRPDTLPDLLGGALVTTERRWSAADLDLLSRQATRALADLGVGPGDRVGLWLPNGPMWLALLMACARRGAVAVSLNTRYRSADVGDIVRRAGCSVLALWPGFKGIDFAGILAAVPAEDLAGVRAVLTCGGGDPLPGRARLDWITVEALEPLDEDLSAPEAPVAIFTTSGTTSRPKLVLHDQRTLVRHARAVARAHGFGAGPSLQALPFCGIFGFCQILAAQAAGVDSIVPTHFEAAAVADLALRHQPTHCYASDEMAHAFLAALPGRLDSLRLLGFARFSPALADLADLAEAKGVGLRGLYGISEVQALFALQPPGPRALAAGGVPVHPEAEVRARGPDSGALLPHGVPGALEIRAPSLFLRYDGDTEATAEAFTEDGFFRTGDLAETTEDGGFIFHTRLGGVVRLGGFLVAPAEIERHIEDLEGVEACVVVAAPKGDRLLPVAFLRGTATEAAVIAHCKGALAGYKVPARAVTVEDFPTTAGPNGLKVQRHVLRQRAAALLAAEDA